LQLNIEKLVYGGDGLARLPADEQGRGKTVFVPFVLEGETVEAELVEQKKGFARGRANAILQAASSRIEPGCPYFTRCGGCHYQQAGYEHQLEIKAAILKENLRRLAKLELKTELRVHSSPPWNYRNRTRLKIQTAPQFGLGYYRLGSHELLPIEQCPISSPLINRTISTLWELGKAGGIGTEIEDIEIFAADDEAQLLIELHCTTDAPRSLLRQRAEEMKSALPGVEGVIVFRNSIAAHSAVEPKAIVTVGAGSLTYKAGEKSYRVSAGAFFQVNRHLTAKLIEIVTKNTIGRMALDLYAGVGLFSTALAESFAQVIAVEPSPISFADLAYNSPANVKPVRATTDQFLKNEGAGLKPDLIVVDPPRSGLGESTVRQLAKLNSPRITYVSCDPATLSRDLVGLLEQGYRIEQAHLLDLFPQTFHLESVLQLVR
jgi:23S rRNA (uracil1939-C5)-methyltransferase